MSAVEIAKQTAYSSAQLIAAVKAESSDDNVILGHMRNTLGDLGVVLGVIVDRVARKQAEAAPRTVPPSRAVHGGIVAMKLRGRLNEAQLRGLNCIHCGRSGSELGDAPMVAAGILDGGALWRCQTDCIPPSASNVNPAYVPDELVNLVREQRGLAGIFANGEDIRAELAEILVAAKKLMLL